MSKGIAFRIKTTFGNTTPQLEKLNPQIGDAIPIKIGNKIIYHLVTKQKYFHKPKYDDIKLTIQNLKKSMQKLHDFKIAIPTIASGVDKCNWAIIKQSIFKEFSNTNIDLLICHKDKTHITNNWKTHEHQKVINLIRDHYHSHKIIKKSNNINDSFNDKIRTPNNNLNNNMSKIIKINDDHNIKIDTKDSNTIKSIFESYKPGENVAGDGNCGIYAVCNALNDNKLNKITSIADILQLFNITQLPNYWMSDDELAAIADYYNHDTYIYNDTNKTAIIYQKKNYNNRPAIVLYNVNNNTHWIPGTRTDKPSNKIPHKHIIINDVPPLQTLINNIKKNNSISNDTLPNDFINIKKPLNNNNNIKSVNNYTKIPNTITNNYDDKETLMDNEGTIINISQHLDKYQHKKVVELLKKFIHLFTTDTSYIKCANIDPCEIKLKQNYTDPKFNAPHRVSPQQREELKIQLDKLLNANIIRPITSKFAAPAFLVKKKEKGSYRLVVSYKELNDRVETDQYPLPRTTDLLRALEGSKYFSSLDLNSGFFQLPVKEEDQYKLAFTSCHGLFTFTRIPQGLKVSSSIFQRKLNEAFSELLYKSLVIYIDDLASYGKDFEQALNNLNNALLIMDKLNFSLKTSKCFFFNNKIELLGHIITREGIKPMDKNTKAITEFKQPTTQKEVRSFIGMCSYYRKHVKDFAKIAHPLTELIKGDNKKIDWQIEHEESFKKLKQYLISEPLLKHFDDDKHVFLTTDASITGLGAYIEQADNNNILHPVGYASRKLLANEKTYSSTTLELLGLCFGITYFREYLWGRHFTVFCDNISLQYYKNLKIPSARIARLTLKLLDFDFDIIYKKGKENLIADALSRNAVNKIDVIVENEHTEINLDLDNIKNEQTKDKFCSDIIKTIIEPNNKNISKNIKRKTRRFTLLNAILYYKKFTPPKNFVPILVVPKTLINNILKSYHESPTGGHTGITRTIHKIQNKYYWENLVKDTTEFIKTCHKCQINKKSEGKPIGQLQPIQLSNRPLDRLTFDYLGPLTTSNKKKYVLVAACNNTKFIFTKAVASASAESTVKFIIQIVSHWGCFQIFSSDRGTHFKNKLVNDICNNLGIKQVLSTSYSPQSQGLVEKINGVLTTSLKNYIEDNNQSRWSYYLPYVTLSYNATPQTSTKYSPFYLMHGFEPYFPIDNKLIPNNLPYDIKKSLIELNEIRNKIPSIVSVAQQNQKKYHDKSHKIISFNPGNLVLIKFPFSEIGKSPKLGPKYRGPFKILEKINDLNYKVELILDNKVTEDIIHVRRLKPYHSREDTDN
ncbi:unnamed protein product [Aphis gossypii]|uniref:RNA-directed DNA polymerase n=1 Tax=Aphis gossypii TaxID=80765 RepID=A0A9P0IY54_APHGO|nr:unnamed protein product [Aphis gossypii]